MADDMVRNAIRRTKCFWYLPQTIWFNFYYLPFKQAIKLPILLYKPKLLRCKGTLTLNGAISFGIIKLGFYTVPNYPNNGITWNVRGNVIIEDFCIIGNDSLIDVGEKGTLTLGKHFISSAALKINCYNSISFGSNNMIGFGNHFIDTNIHTYKIVKRGREFKAKGYAPIVIGSYNWFGFGITTIAGTTTPDYCIVGAKSYLNRSYAALPQKCFIGGSPAELKATDVYRDFNDDDIDYE